eukprot:661809-Prymnesium_polylepis.1
MWVCDITPLGWGPPLPFYWNLLTAYAAKNRTLYSCTVYGFIYVLATTTQQTREKKEYRRVLTHRTRVVPFRTDRV